MHSRDLAEARRRGRKEELRLERQQAHPQATVKHTGFLLRVRLQGGLGQNHRNSAGETILVKTRRELL